MNCRDFREIADSYLSDELAVETNHEIFQHLENCANCRHELGMRREIRDKLRQSFKKSNDFAINPFFANKLQATLKAEANRHSKWFNWKILAPIFTGLIAVIGLAFGFSNSVKSIETTNPLSQNELSQLYSKAIGKHENCGLKNLHRWESAHKYFDEKSTFVKTLNHDGTEILENHTCSIDSKPYEHYIMRRNGKVFSVLRTESKENFSLNPDEEVLITCKKKKKMKIAGFKVKDILVFVVSDMSESENLTIARQLSDSIEI